MSLDAFKEGLAAARRGDYAAAARLWRSLAEKGDARAQYNLGFLHANGQGVDQDYTSALDWYTRAGKQGFAPAQFNLGVLYSSDDGVPPDFALALQWYRQAAEQGDTDERCCRTDSGAVGELPGRRAAVALSRRCPGVPFVMGCLRGLRCGGGNTRSGRQRQPPP